MRNTSLLFAVLLFNQSKWSPETHGPNRNCVSWSHATGHNNNCSKPAVAAEIGPKLKMEKASVHGSGRVKFAGVGKCDENESAWIAGIKEICRIFNVPDLKDDQELALQSLFQDRNIYFSAPTGYGKSLVFQSIPILADHLLNRPLFTSIILVISPLMSLMLDQVKYLESKGLCALAIASEDDIAKDTISSVKEGL